MPGGVGILVPDPLKDPADFEARIPTEVDVKDKLSHVIQAVARIKEVSFVSPLQPCLKPDGNSRPSPVPHSTQFTVSVDIRMYLPHAGYMVVLVRGRCMRLSLDFGTR